jgi:two-component system sensor histidine kinase KdpD
MDEKEFGVAAWVYWNEKKAGRFTDTLPSVRATYYPLSGPRYPLGVVGVHRTPEAPLTIDQQHLLESFVRQLASALEREQLNEITKQTVVLAESERLYKALFSSLSHELRTPLTAILGATENLQEAGCADPALQVTLLSEIASAAGRLDRLLQNLLDMTRVDSGLIRAHVDWCDIRDILSKAVQDVRAETGRAITMELPPGTSLIRADYGLLVQSVTNIVRNAAMYTPPSAAIDVSARIEGTECLIVISDTGPGIPPAALPHLFEKFYRIEGTRTGGTGLGLAIARGFLEAQHGSVAVENRPEGGARFTIRLAYTPPGPSPQEEHT